MLSSEKIFTKSTQIVVESSNGFAAGQFENGSSDSPEAAHIPWIGEKPSKRH